MPPVATSQHLTSELLTRWAKMELGNQEAEEVENHLIECESCARQACIGDLLADHPVASFLKDGLRRERQGSDTVMEPGYRETQIATSNLDAVDLITENLSENFVRMEMHGAGGIGEVWKARDQTFGRIVAIKNLNEQIQNSSTARSRFLREAIITGQLQHPGIVPVYSLCSTNEDLFYAMRLIEGQSLLESIQRFHYARQNQSDASDEAVVEFSRLLRHFVSVCDTIAFAHSRGVIHRDIKSENVIIGDFGEVVLLDWGLAKFVHETESPWTSDDGQSDSFHCRQTVVGQRLGTPAFMSPEQARGDTEKVGFSSDIWGLSAMLYEILCGEPPFNAVSTEVTMRQVIEEPVRPCRQIIESIPVELEEICLAGLNKNPERRPYSAKQIAERISNWLDHQVQQKQSYEERQNFFNISSEMMAILHPRKGIQQANAAWSKILGWATAELLGKRHVDLIPSEHQKRVGRLLYLAGKGQPAIDIEVPFFHKSGHLVWTSWTATPYQDDRRVYVIGRDISERRRTRELLTQLFDSAPDAMVVLSTEGELKMINRQAEVMFEYSRDELTGRSINILLTQSHRDKQTQFLAGFVDGGSHSSRRKLKVTGLTRSGKALNLEISLRLIRLGEDLKLIAAAIRRGSN